MGKINQVMQERWEHRWDAEPPKTDKKAVRGPVVGFFGTLAWLGSTGFAFSQFNGSFGEEASWWGLLTVFFLFLPAIIGAIALIIWMIRSVGQKKRAYFAAATSPEDLERRKQNWALGQTAAMYGAWGAMAAWNAHGRAQERELVDRNRQDAESMAFWRQDGDQPVGPSVDLSGYDRPTGSTVFHNDGTMMSQHYVTGNAGPTLDSAQYPFLDSQRQGRY